MDYEYKRKCTCKERKQAARILAAREGFERSQEKHIKAVGAMSDDDVIKFLDDNMMQAVEVLPPGSVEEITPGGDPEQIYNLLVDIVNNYIISNNWDGEKISPLQWGACCQSAGRFARSHSFFRGVPVNENNNKGIRDINALKGVDVEAVAGALPVWLELCNKYNKVPIKSDFLAFCGLDFAWLYDYRTPAGVTSPRDEILKILDNIQADGLRKRVINPKESPIGAIFLLKADHGLVEAQKVTHEYIKRDSSGESLPVFGSFDALEDKKPEN